MFITKKHLSRRTFLRGAGVAVALPFLESMVPAQTPRQRLPQARWHAGDSSTCSRLNHEAVDAGEGGRRLRVLTHPQASGSRSGTM